MVLERPMKERNGGGEVRRRRGSALLNHRAEVGDGTVGCYTQQSGMWGLVGCSSGAISR
jgi:hypothetical protein